MLTLSYSRDFDVHLFVEMWSNEWKKGPDHRPVWPAQLPKPNAPVAWYDNYDFLIERTPRRDRPSLRYEGLVYMIDLHAKRRTPSPVCWPILHLFHVNMWM